MRRPVEGGPERADGALEDRGVGLVEVQVVQPHQLPRPRGLMHSLKITDESLCCDDVQLNIQRDTYI